MRLQSSIPLALLLSTTTLASAQTLPGYQGDHHQMRAEYRAKALNQFQEVVGSWVRAVNDEDSEAAARLYAEDAFVHLDRSTGPGEVTELLEQWLIRIPQIRVGLSDFDVSGEVAYGSLRVQFLGSGSTPNVDGMMALVMRRHGRDWKIRSQVMVVDPPESVAGSRSSLNGTGF